MHKDCSIGPNIRRGRGGNRRRRCDIAAKLRRLVQACASDLRIVASAGAGTSMQRGAITVSFR